MLEKEIKFLDKCLRIVEYEHLETSLVNTLDGKEHLAVSAVNHCKRLRGNQNYKDSDIDTIRCQGEYFAPSILPQRHELCDLRYINCKFLS